MFRKYSRLEVFLFLFFKISDTSYLGEKDRFKNIEKRSSTSSSSNDDLSGVGGRAGGGHFISPNWCHKADSGSAKISFSTFFVLQKF